MRDLLLALPHHALARAVAPAPSATRGAPAACYQKMSGAACDGGYASTLLSRGIVRVAAKPGQHIDMMDVPMETVQSRNADITVVS
jgi:hypothetical protein